MFDAVVESSVVGVRKPDERFYLLACDALGISPRQAVFLDDLGVNLKPARALGMTTIKVTDTPERVDRARAGRRHRPALTAQANARRRRSSCSSRCRAALPVAGLADSARLTCVSVKRSRNSRCRRPCANDHAPMFSGSSCTKTT